MILVYHRSTPGAIFIVVNEMDSATRVQILFEFHIQDKKHPAILPPALVKIVGQIVNINLGMTTSHGDGKLYSNLCLKKD